MADAAIFDVDGTLIDTNYHHAVAWFRAFRSIDITVPIWRIHRASAQVATIWSRP